MGKTLTDLGKDPMIGHFKCGNEQCRCKKTGKFIDYFSDYQHMKISCIMDIITVGNLFLLHACC
jgi:hypothetical protein